MRNFLILFLIVLFFIFLVLTQVFGKSKTKDLGVKDGMLAPCPSTPNCISTQGDPADTEHYMAPIKYEGTKEEAMQKIVDVVNSMERTKIITREDNYLYTTFTSKIMKYVDDVEFYLDDNAKLIHFRSASRVGYSDLGVNRARMEEIVKRFGE